MRSLILIATVTTLVAARPELYKEKEDFQFSRSSTDEGTKSGYYGAQRGNMGGNYERAHNMDGLAQHQMSGAVHQVEGELGDAAKMRTGSVYTAANSRGTYGSGRYNLNNLEGRNFEEGMSYDDSQSQNSQRNSAFRQHSSGSNSNSYGNSYSHNSGQSSLQRSEYQGHEMQSSSNLQDDSYSQQGYSGYGDTSKSSHALYPQNRLVNTRPVRIMIRPGSRVSVPVAAQSYNSEHRASAYDSSSYDQNASKSDAEVIINNDQETNSRYNHNNPRNKHYEQSYSYRKEWEKHDTSPPEVAPLSIPTESSLYEGSMYDNSQTYNARNHHQSSGADTHNSQYSSNIKSASNSHRFNHNSQQESLSSGSGIYSGRNADYMSQLANSQTTSTNSMPQSYQSSYSYHKSWERQGDPYVIVPVPSGNKNGQTSQRMTSSNAHDAHSSHHYGSQRKQSYQSYSDSNGLDCDDEGHIRVARSYNTNDEFYSPQNQQSRKLDAYNGGDNFSQQTQNQWGNMEDLGQQSQNKWDNWEDNGQQTQNSWDKVEDLGQQSQNKWDNLEELGQQTHNSWDKVENLGQQSQNKWDNLEDLGQQTHNSWDKVEDLGQQSQNKWDNLEDLGQQTQNSWGKVEDLGQQSQNKWDNLEDLGQQTQNKWDKTEDFGQQNYNTRDPGQQTQNTWNNNEDLSQQSQTQWDGLKQHGQESQSNTDQHQNTWDNSEQSAIHTNSNNFGQENSDQQFKENWNLRDKVPQNPGSSQAQNINEQDKISNTDTSRITQNAPQDLKENNYNPNLWNKIDFFESFQNHPYFNRETENYNEKKYNNPQAFNDDTAFDNQHTNKDNINVNTEHQKSSPNHFYDDRQQNNNYDGHSEFNSTSSNSWYDASSLNTFWNKLDSFDQDTSMSFDTSTKSDSDSDITGKHLTHSNHDVNYQEQNKSHSTHSTDQHNQISSTNIGHQSNDITSTTMKTKDDETVLSLPRDIGRGDIGAEDFKEETVSTTTLSDLNIFEINNNKYKTLEEIEALSLIKEGNVSDIGTIGSLNKTRDTNGIIYMPIELSSHANNISNHENKNYELEQSPEEINQQYDEQRYLPLAHIQPPQEDLKHFDYQNMNHQNSEDFGQYSQNLNQQNMEQNFVDFAQHSEDKEQNMDKNFEDFGLHSQEQKNLEDFGQHSQDQQNLEDFGQLSQQNLEDFGQLSQDQQNMQQNLEDFGQHSQDLSSQNIKDFGQFKQDLSQENLNQQYVENFGQHSQDINQQNIGSFDEQDYQKPNMEQRFEHFEDQKFNDKNGKLNQQYLRDNTHQTENLREEKMVQKIENKHLQIGNLRNYDENIKSTEKTFPLSEHSGRSLDESEIPLNQVQQLENSHPKAYSLDYNKQDGDPAVENSQSVQRVEENYLSTSTPASVTEKPGFWSSVGNKLSKAKNKIASWFGRS